VEETTRGLGVARWSCSCGVVLEIIIVVTSDLFRNVTLPDTPQNPLNSLKKGKMI
jgi:hypothetical protein